MKVLLVNKFHYRKGGSETYYFALAEALRAGGHEVVFFAMKDEEKNISCDQEQYFVSNASVGGGMKSKLNMLLHMNYSKEAYRKMKQLLEAEKPELVILNLVHKQITLSILDAIKEFDPKLPVFWTMHDLIAVCPSYTMRDGSGNICEKCLGGDFTHCVKNKCIKGSALMSMLSRYEAEFIRKHRLYDKADLYICPSEFYRSKLLEGHFTDSPIVTMRNLLPLSTEYSVNDEIGDYVLYFGRLSHEKGVGTLIQAAKQCGCRLVILGTGPQEAELKALAADAGNVEFKGFQTGEPLKNYVRNSRCVVLPSEWYENGPYSAMEAMSMGKPLIVSDRGGLPELVEDGVNGYIYRGGAKELSEKITELLGLSEMTYQAMAEASLKRAKEQFSPENYVEQLMGYYREIKENK